MARSIILLFLAIAFVTITAYPQTQNPKQCGENEVYTTCGSSCPISCQNPTPQVCTLACVIGCECQEGYVRSEANKCVLTQDC